uniref:Uncharacterized protein n=2 Tax=Anguilla anguilla TaxID=7936 RepID=A0A0E9RJS7_ANGAN
MLSNKFPHCSKMILIVIAKSSRLTEFNQSLLSYRSVWSHGCRAVCLPNMHLPRTIPLYLNLR